MLNSSVVEEDRKIISECGLHDKYFICALKFAASKC